MPLIDALASPAGRIARGLLGTGLIVLGAVLGGGWLLLALPGALFLITGIAGICLIAPLVGRPLRAPRPS